MRNKYFLPVDSPDIHARSERRGATAAQDVRIVRTVPMGPISSRFLMQSAKAALRLEKVRRARLSFIFVDDEEISRINRRFLRHRGPTDVITFPLEKEPELEAEVYISADTARENARIFRASAREELVRLMIHAILHLHGYDDKTESKAERMRKRENLLLKGIFGKVGIV